jgi:uncharacterized repeat protein (TIGR03803 family)
VCSKGFFRSIRAFAIADLLILVHLCSLSVAQSTYTVLYNFGNYAGDGVGPSGGLLIDAAGNFYGITGGGGAYCQSTGGCGTVYELSPSAGGSWTDTVLYSFCTTGDPNTCLDGAAPFAGLASDKAGNLYGTTSSGGAGKQGVVFRLSPPQQPGGGSWTQTVLWTFGLGKNSGTFPGFGKLNIDGSGNIYGTTAGGGRKNDGIVFELSPAGSGTYTFTILHSFSGPDGAVPLYGVAIDNAGNLYGTTQLGGPSNPACVGGVGGCGVVYKLSQSGGKWSETLLYKFKGGSAGSEPVSPINSDQAGNLYGTFSTGGQEGNCSPGTCGGVFKLTGADGGKADTFSFNGENGGYPQSGVLPVSESMMFGTSTAQRGNIFQIQGKTETVLYTFCSLPNCTDGSSPGYGTLMRHGNALYGVTLRGGLNNNSGVLYSITP